jgi:hypothetical protein
MKTALKTLTLILGISVALPAMSGRELAEALDAKAKPKDSRATLTMTLTNKAGKQQNKQLRSLGIDNNRKQIIWFLAPARDKGVSFLKIEHDDKDDEMALWLPAFKKVRYIRSSDKGDNFMGSDLSYEDMSNRELDDYDYRITGSEMVNGADCYILESIPKAEAQSSYSKIVTWIEKGALLPVKEHFYNLKEQLWKEKTVEFTTIKGYDFLQKMFVKDILSNHSTELKMENVELDSGLDDAIFQEKNLQRNPM